MSPDDDARLAAEQRARVLIDRQLTAADWSVQDKRAMNLFAGKAPHGVAVREIVMKPGHGRADYLLYVDQKVVGVIEAKPEGAPLSGVEWQSAMYAEGLPADVKLAALTKDGRLPFVFEASGTETHFTNGYDPEPRAHRIFNFPKASTLARTLRNKDDEQPTWRGKVTVMPALDVNQLRPAQTHCDQRRRDEPQGAAVRPQPGANGDRRGQDLHRHHPVLPALEVRRLLSDPVPGRPQHLGQADDGRVRELPHARRRPTLHRALQRQPPQPRADARVDKCRDLDHPASLPSAAQRRGRRHRRS